MKDEAKMKKNKKIEKHVQIVDDTREINTRDINTRNMLIN
jgi:hypothetical protein